jgi:hypothetical protein
VLSNKRKNLNERKIDIAMIALLQPFMLEESFKSRSLKYLIVEALDAKVTKEISKNINLSKQSLNVFRKAYKDLTDASAGVNVKTPTLDKYLQSFEEFLNEHLNSLSKLDDEDEEKIRKLSASSLNAASQYLSMLDILVQAIENIQTNFEQPNTTDALQTNIPVKRLKTESENFAKLMKRTMGAQKGVFAALKNFNKNFLSGLPRPPIANEKAWKELFDALIAGSKVQTDDFLKDVNNNKKSIQDAVDAMTAAITPTGTGPTPTGTGPTPTGTGPTPTGTGPTPTGTGPTPTGGSKPKIDDDINTIINKVVKKWQEDKVEKSGDARKAREQSASIRDLLDDIDANKLTRQLRDLVRTTVTSKAEAWFSSQGKDHVTPDEYNKFKKDYIDDIIDMIVDKKFESSQHLTKKSIERFVFRYLDRKFKNKNGLNESRTLSQGQNSTNTVDFARINRLAGLED